ncbi:hypothetical protein GCM10011379_27030 [Filimonas zeae]|uniref:Uncharacterized protein n=1 Tax=Filimonas zeae TaxID=1737353 RepID=A0A917J048_9BACT|nr:hypothetical protein GCM10011379_27030 [Filimonas zeae]
MFLWNTAAAQQGKETIHITTSTTDITSLAKDISAQTGLKYSLNMQNTSLRKKIVLRPGNYPLSQVLEQVKKQAGLQYKILGTHILFVDYSAGSAAAKSAPAAKSASNAKPTPAVKPGLAVKPAPVTKNGQALQTPSKVVKRTVPVKVQTRIHKPTPPTSAVKVGQPAEKKSLTPVDSSVIPIAARQWAATANNNTAFLMAAWLKARDTVLPVQPAKKAVATSTLPVQPAAVNTAEQPDRKRGWWQPVLKVGVTADELLYAGAHVQAGLQWLYGIAAWGTNFKNAQFRWGAGLSLPVAGSQQIHVNFTTGAASAFYAEDSAYRAVWEKERLHRLGIAWSKDIGSRLNIQVQLHYNLLHQSFTAATDTSAATDRNPLTGNFDERYRVFVPPYTLGKTTGSNTADRSWLGMQLTLFYRFL